MDPWFSSIIKYLITFTIFITALSAEALRKSYNESIQLSCPDCDSNECPISINGVSTTTMAGSAKYTIQDNRLILPPDDWGSYGRICCGTTGQQSCYTVCPQRTETCDSCLTLSVNVTTAVVGDVIMVNSTIRQQPHNGITLFINGIAFTDPSSDLSCSTKSKVLGQFVMFYCTTKKTGTVYIKTNTGFCDTELSSQEIDITIEEQRTMPNETLNEHESSTIIPSSMTDAGINPSSTITTTTTAAAAMTTIVPNDNTSTVASVNSTAANVPTGEPRKATADNSMVTWLIVSIVIILLLILGVVIMILVGIRKRGAKQGNTPTLETPAVHPPVSVAGDDGSNIGYDSTDTVSDEYLQHDDSRSASELTPQQPQPCDQSHVVQQ